MEDRPGLEDGVHEGAAARWLLRKNREGLRLVRIAPILGRNLDYAELLVLLARDPHDSARTRAAIGRSKFERAVFAVRSELEPMIRAAQVEQPLRPHVILIRDPLLRRELAELLSANELSEIEVEDGDRKIRVRRELTVAAAPVQDRAAA